MMALLHGFGFFQTLSNLTDQMLVIQNIRSWSGSKAPPMAPPAIDRIPPISMDFRVDSNSPSKKSLSSLLTAILAVGLLVAPESTMAQITLVCDRSPDVRDEIVKRVPGVSDCADVTEAHLGEIRFLILTGPYIVFATHHGRPTPIYELRSGDFSGLKSLEKLEINYNELESLPPDIFSGLSALEVLGMGSNPLESLPPDIFSGLSSLKVLGMGGIRLTSLPVHIFSGLSSLKRLHLSTNRLTSLPPDIFSGLSALEVLYMDSNPLESLPPDIFSGLSSLRELYLQDHRLTSLPEGLFVGLSSLRKLKLDGNLRRLPITVSLERVGESQFLAKAHTGAPFELVLPITSVSGEMDDNASSIIIPAGSLESAVHTISRKPDAVSAVTVNITDLPRLPPFHSGYELVKSPNLLLVVYDALGLNFPHFANGASIFSDLVLVNIGTTAIHPAIYFFDTEGNRIDAESVVDILGDLEILEDGALGPQAELAPLGETTISTHGRGELVTGSAQVIANGPLGGFLRFDSPGLGVAGVGTSPPASDVIFPARRQAEGINTGTAIRNLTGIETTVTCQLMQNGLVLDETEIPLAAAGQVAQFIHEMFPGTDTSDFEGSVRCTMSGGGRFTGVALEMDAGNRIFTTLPVVPIPR